MEKHRVVVIEAGRRRDGFVAEAIRNAIVRAGAEPVVTRDLLNRGSGSEETLASGFTDAVLVIANLTELDSSPQSMVELGFVRALKRPMFIVASIDHTIPFTLSSAYPVLFYSPRESEKKFREELQRAVIKVLSQIELATPDCVLKEREKLRTVFISYCHTDAAFVERIFVHLKPLSKRGLLDPWADTRLKTGDDWRREVEKALDVAQAAILVVSADFLASDFIVDHELPPLLVKAEKAGTRILPLVVKPCRFLREPSLNRFHAVNDPQRPLLLFAECERESVYDHLANDIEDWLATR